jgi:hypothetical protein
MLPTSATKPQGAAPQQHPGDNVEVPADSLFAGDGGGILARAVGGINGSRSRAVRCIGRCVLRALHLDANLRRCVRPQRATSKTCPKAGRNGRMGAGRRPFNGGSQHSQCWDSCINFSLCQRKDFGEDYSVVSTEFLRFPGPNPVQEFAPPRRRGAPEPSPASGPNILGRCRGRSPPSGQGQQPNPTGPF